jgi:hypothetical protein
MALWNAMEPSLTGEVMQPTFRQPLFLTSSKRAVEAPADARPPPLGAHADEVDVGLALLGLGDEADQEGDELPTLLDREARVAEVLEEEAGSSRAMSLPPHHSLTKGTTVPWSSSRIALTMVPKVPPSCAPPTVDRAVCNRRGLPAYLILQTHEERMRTEEAKGKAEGRRRTKSERRGASVWAC